MKLKQIVLMSITALSLSGSLYGMEANIDNALKRFFELIWEGKESDIQEIEELLVQHPTIINATDPEEDEIKNTALDYVIQKPKFVGMLLRHKININVAEENYLNNVIRSKYFNNLDDKKTIIHLLCFHGATMGSGNAEIYRQDPQDALTVAELSGDDEIVAIIQNHIHTRLYDAISNGNMNEVRRLVAKYNLNVNQALPSYIYVSTQSDPLHTFLIPLHTAVMANQHDVVRLLVNELNADVTIRDAYGQNALHHEPNAEIAQLLIAKGCDINLADNNGARPIDQTIWPLTPDGLIEIQPERIENFRALKQIFEGRPYIPANNPPVIDNNAFSWKWIGGGVVVVVAVVAAKKLYNWWYKDAEKEAVDADAAEHNESGQETAKDKAATQA